MTGKDLMTVEQLCAEYPAFTEKSVRWWIYNGKRNGFESCVLRIGSRIYIDKPKFEAWLESHRPVPDIIAVDEETI